MPIHMRMRKLRGPHMKKSMPFEPFRTHTQPVNVSSTSRSRFEAGAEVTLEALQAKGLATRKGDSGQDPRQGRAHQGAHRPGPRLQRRRARARSRPPAAPARSSSSRSGPTRPTARIGTPAGIGPRERTPCSPRSSTPSGSRDIRKKIAFTAAMLLPLPARLAHPGAGRQPRRPSTTSRRTSAAQQHPRPAEPVLRRRPLATRDLRAGDHALHHRLDHPAAAAGGRALAGEALQGGRGRPGADHPVHPLPDRRPGVRAVDRLRVPVPHASQARRANRWSPTSTPPTSS